MFSWFEKTARPNNTGRKDVRLHRWDFYSKVFWKCLGLNTANQPSETDQSVLGSDHHYFQIEGIEMTSSTKTEMSTMTKWKEKDQACPTTNTHYTELTLHTIKMIQSRWTLWIWTGEQRQTRHQFCTRLFIVSNFYNARTDFIFSRLIC